MLKDRMVHFEGRWTDEERRAVVQAARQTEGGLLPDSTAGLLGCPWACTRIEWRAQTYYLAHWTRCPTRIFRATSAAALAREIGAARPKPDAWEGNPHRFPAASEADALVISRAASAASG